MNVETLKGKLQNITGNHNLNDYSYGYYTACGIEETNELELLCLWFNEHSEGNDIIVPIENIPQSIIEESLDFNFCLYIRNKSHIEGSKFYLFNDARLRALPALVYDNLIRDKDYTDFTLFFKGEPVNMTCLYECNDKMVSFYGLGGIENDIVSDRRTVFGVDDENLRFGEYHWLTLEDEGMKKGRKISDTNVTWEDINYCEFGIIGVFAAVESETDFENYSAVNGGKDSIFRTEIEAIEYCKQLKEKNPNMNYAYIDGDSLRYYDK